MKNKDLIELLQTIPEDTEVFVGAWSPEEDYDHTDKIKVCQLSGTKPKIVICDKNAEYWTREIKLKN